MGKAARRKDATTQQKLAELYAELPKIDCRGACWDSCTSIRMTSVERRAVDALGTGIHIPNRTQADGVAVCEALTLLRRCAVHEARPLICRLWGLTESLPCTFGCRPEGGLLSDAEGYLFLARVHELSGDLLVARKLREMWSPENREQTARMLKESLAADDERYEGARRHLLKKTGGQALLARGRGVLERWDGDG